MKHLAIFLLLLAPVLASCSGDKDGQGGRQAAPVHVMTVQPQDVPRVLGAVGNVKASASVGLTPRVTGEIEKVHFTEGQDVKEGDVLLTIDTRPFEATLREKKGQLAKSEAQLHKATNDAGRYGKLVGNGYVSREAYEQTATEAAAISVEGSVTAACALNVTGAPAAESAGVSAGEGFSLSENSENSIVVAAAA